MSYINIKTPVPGPKSQALMERRKQAIARGPFHSTPLFVAKARGALVEDVDENIFLDFSSGIGVANVGHTQEKVVHAVQDQVEKFLHTSFNVLAYESYVKLAEKLNARTPGKFSKKTFLANSGAEAVENAIKIARAYTQKPGVVCFEHAFHGRTFMAMTLTAKEKPYRYGFGPLMENVYRATYPYLYRWPTSTQKATIVDECFDQFEKTVESAGGPGQIAALIIEPMQGEGGFIPAPAEFLKRLQEYCRKNQIVFIVDEIQTGFGRTGTWFASEQLGIEPDLLTMAKGLGGGMPISAVTGRAEMMDAPIEGAIGGTYGGNPVCCAAALAVISLFEDGKILERAQHIGKILQKRLAQWHGRFEQIGDVRGIGPMQAFELVKDRSSKEPDKDSAAKLAQYCYLNGVVVLTAGTYSNVVRLLVPLVINDDQLNEGLAVIESGLEKILE